MVKLTSLGQSEHTNQKTETKTNLATRFKFFSLGDDTFMVIDVVLPTMLGPVRHGRG